MAEAWTIRKVLNWTRGFFERKGIESARLDAELLIGSVLNLERIMIYTQFDKPLSSDELAGIRALVERRAKNEPVAYILKTRGFWTLDLTVDNRVLVPRPETERLVEFALEHLKDQQAPTIFDVGTGSGAIALAIASERPDAHVIAFDTSPDALAVARENTARLKLENVSFRQGNLLEGVTDSAQLIVSNPPYIPSREVDELMPDVLDYEPRLALDGGPDGLDLIRRLVPQAKALLADGGVLLMEMALGQGPAIEQLCLEAGFAAAESRPDFSGRDRVVEARL